MLSFVVLHSRSVGLVPCIDTINEYIAASSHILGHASTIFPFVGLLLEVWMEYGVSVLNRGGNNQLPNNAPLHPKTLFMAMNNLRMKMECGNATVS